MSFRSSFGDFRKYFKILARVFKSWIFGSFVLRQKNRKFKLLQICKISIPQFLAKSQKSLISHKGVQKISERFFYQELQFFNCLQLINTIFREKVFVFKINSYICLAKDGILSKHTCFFNFWNQFFRSIFLHYFYNYYNYNYYPVIGVHYYISTFAMLLFFKSEKKSVI